MIDYYYEQLNFTERRIYKSIYVSIVNKESYVYIAHIKKENLEKIYMASLHSAFADDDTKQVLWKMESGC